MGLPVHILRDIDPSLTVRTYETFVLPDNVAGILDAEPDVDYIVDAVDTVSAKIALAAEARQRGIKIISSMGTGNKLHAELFMIADLSETSVCPLSRVMRRELRKRGITHLKVLYSREEPVDTDGRMTGEDTGMRRSVPGSISFVPPVAGLLIAGEVIRDLAGDESERKSEDGSV